MGIYSEKLCNLVPVIKKVFRKKGDMIYVNVEMEKWTKEYYAIEYLKPVWDKLESGEGGIVNKCYFLVTEEESIGVKAAFAILNYPTYAGEQMNDVPNKEGRIKGHMPELQKSDKMLSYIASKNEYAGFLRSSESMGYPYFSGLDESDRNELEVKLHCVMSCGARIQFVQIKKEYLCRAWARELLKNRECEIIDLPKVNFSFYLYIMEGLLLGERYKMDSDIKREQILRNIQKKCGNCFSEEDIAWSLDQAEKNAAARWDLRCLKAEDFKLDIYEKESPMKKLDALIGLEDMKMLAHEYAALSREQLRNEKLVDICKHVVFVGKPGTGKTMCGELLARIMAEHGQSNGNFIMASRKDIIAEFVGQTAPMVAKLFSRARKGVLFIDEAGFFLHDTKDSFAKEAIKEFVRYMELYQDVTVIFALYPGEVENWFQLDSGLSSRIGRVIYFEDYSEEELLAIVNNMCEDRGYHMSKEAEEIIRYYLYRQRKNKGEEFGNAREGRKLVESAVIARSIRCFDSQEADMPPMLSAEDFEYGIRRLEHGWNQRKKIMPIGFATGGI